MKHLDELNFLIDSAVKIAGNDNKLAAACGTTRMKINDWRKGRIPCPPEQQALIAAVAGFDPATTILRAVVEKHEGTALGDRLMRALGKASRATGAVLGFVGASALAIYSLSPTPSHARTLLADREHNVYYVKPKIDLTTRHHRRR